MALKRSSQERWVDAGTYAAAVARGYHAIAVVGADGDATAAVARGIGSAIAPTRRVILADLVGDVPALRDLSTEPDPEGVEDSFDFGISLARVAHQTPVENFMLIPSASDAVAREEIFRSGRWTRLARQCRASGWLLVVVVRAGTPGVSALIEQLDGAILLPDTSVEGDVRVLHRIDDSHVRKVVLSRRAVAVGVATAVMAAIAAAMLWNAYARTPGRAAPAAAPAIVTADTMRADTLTPLNPTDSVVAAAYAVEMMSANTRAGANLELQRMRSVYPAATLGAATVGEARATWFRLVAGAFAEPARADSLLRAAREAGQMSGIGVAVIRAPFALLVDSAVTQAESQGVVARYVERGVPAYALMQSDGRVRIYVGAFVTPHESLTFMDELNDSESKPVLVYRTGRAF